MRRNKKFSSEHAGFEMCVKYPSGEIRQAVGELGLEG